MQATREAGNAPGDAPLGKIPDQQLVLAAAIQRLARCGKGEGGDRHRRAVSLRGIRVDQPRVLSQRNLFGRAIEKRTLLNPCANCPQLSSRKRRRLFRHPLAGIRMNEEAVERAVAGIARLKRELAALPRLFQALKSVEPVAPLPVLGIVAGQALFNEDWSHLLPEGDGRVGGRHAEAGQGQEQQRSTGRACGDGRGHKTPCAAEAAGRAPGAVRDDLPRGDR